MKLQRYLISLTAVSVVLVMAGCDPGQTTQWQPTTDLEDSGVASDAARDGQGETDALDAIADSGATRDATRDTSPTPDAVAESDAPSEADATSSEPDVTEPEPDVTEPEPDVTEPEPEPPSWSCGTVACSAVDKTTPLSKMRQLDSCAFELHLEKPLSTGEALADQLLDRLESQNLGTRRSLSYVLDRLNRDAVSGITSQSSSRLSGMNARGFRWNSGDDNVSYWYPQGITGSSDAAANGKVHGKDLIMTAWYHKTDARPTKGARVSLADITNLNNVKYRLLLLVDPVKDSNGNITYKESSYDSGNALHAGGIVWYGDYLFVADTAKGFRIYDMSRIFRPTNFDDKSKIGIHGSKSYAHGYGYAIPRIGRYRLTSDSCSTKFSFIGLDRDSNPPAIVSGEYHSGHPNGKIVTWPLDPATHLLEARRGTTRASDAAVIGQTRAQGGLRHSGYYYISSSSQDGSNGRIYKGRPGHTNSSKKWIYGAEDLYIQRHKNRVWTNGEYPGRRDVVSIPLF